MEDRAQYSPAAAGGKSRTPKAVAKNTPPIVHQLKSEPGPFSDVWDGHKLAEIRRNDRDYRVGQLVVLREMEGPQFSGEEPVYTGRYLAAEVTHIDQCGRWIGAGAAKFVVLSIQVLSKGRM